jgi:phosphate starvation-inducible protein PhoH
MSKEKTGKINVINKKKAVPKSKKKSVKEVIKKEDLKNSSSDSEKSEEETEQESEKPKKEVIKEEKKEKTIEIKNLDGIKYLSTIEDNSVNLILTDPIHYNVINYYNLL